MVLDNNHHAYHIPHHLAQRRLAPVEDIVPDVLPLNILAFKTYMNYSNNHTILDSCELESILSYTELRFVSIFQTSLVFHAAVLSPSSPQEASWTCNFGWVVVGQPTKYRQFQEKGWLWCIQLQTMVS